MRGLLGRAAEEETCQVLVALGCSKSFYCLLMDARIGVGTRKHLSESFDFHLAGCDEVYNDAK